MNKIDWAYIKYFTRDEFKCKCGCECDNVSILFLERLIEARQIADIPFIITSGCRCKKYNDEVGGTEKSAHLCSKHIPCYASDIKCKTDRQRFIIIQALIDVGFTHLGISKKDLFIHVDDDKRKAIWIY